MARKRFRYRKIEGPRFLHVNVGHGKSAHDIALSIAFHSKLDCITLQGLSQIGCA